MFLLSTPFQIQQNVFNHMDPQDLFLMSHCSSLTKEAIKSSLTWTKPLEVITRFSGSKKEEQGEAKRVNFGALSHEKRWNVFEMKKKSKKKSGKNSEILRLNIDGLMVSGDVKFKKSGKMILFVDNFENKLNQIHSYICQLLHTANDLFVQLYSLDEYKLFFQNSIKKSLLYNDAKREIGWKNLDEFFKYHSTQYMSTIVAPRIKSPDMTENEKFTGLQNLLLYDVGEDIYQVMMNFEGEHLIMHSAIPHHASFILFVRSWIEGNHNNLKSIISCNVHDCFIDSEIVLDDLKPTKWDETKRPRYFEYTSVLKKHQSFKPDIFDCEKGLDVTRKTDGALATIKIDGGHFMFFVWP